MPDDLARASGSTLLGHFEQPSNLPRSRKAQAAGEERISDRRARHIVDADLEGGKTERIAEGLKMISRRRAVHRKRPRLAALRRSRWLVVMS